MSTRRSFLTTGLLGGGAVALVLLNQRLWRGVDITPSEALGPLSPVADEATGLPLLMLPPGFSYRSFSWAGSSLHDGHSVPGAADGMGVVAQSGSRITLVRNHELVGSEGVIGLAENAYDINGGGTPHWYLIPRPGPWWIRGSASVVQSTIAPVG